MRQLNRFQFCGGLFLGFMYFIYFWVQFQYLGITSNIAHCIVRVTHSSECNRLSLVSFRVLLKIILKVATCLPHTQQLCTPIEYSTMYLTNAIEYLHFVHTRFAVGRNTGTDPNIARSTKLGFLDVSGCLRFLQALKQTLCEKSNCGMIYTYLACVVY